MALNIKNATVEDLVAEVAVMMRESKTEAIRAAVAELKERLILHDEADNRGVEHVRRTLP